VEATVSEQSGSADLNTPGTMFARPLVLGLRHIRFGAGVPIRPPSPLQCTSLSNGWQSGVLRVNHLRENQQMRAVLRPRLPISSRRSKKVGAFRGPGFKEFGCTGRAGREPVRTVWQKKASASFGAATTYPCVGSGADNSARFIKSRRVGLPQATSATRASV